MAQKFMTYEQQLHKLQADKGLNIPDTDFARKTLEEISYYSLIGGYKGLFLHPASKKYKYGEAQNEYLNPQNFDYSNHPKQVNRLINSLKQTIALPSHYRYIAHHAHKYHNVPLWVATNAMTMGQMSAFYQYMPNDIQVKVSKAYPQYTEKQLHQFITIIAKCRNVCAHGERLFDFRTTDMIPDTLLHKKLGIPCKKGLYQNGKKDLFSVVISLRYLISDEEYKIFRRNLASLIKDILKNCPHLTEDQLLKEMGFPKNWNKITRYKK